MLFRCGKPCNLFCDDAAAVIRIDLCVCTSLSIKNGYGADHEPLS